MSVKVTSKIDDKRPEKMDKAIERALRTIGVLMERAAADLSPAPDTGRLRASITWAMSTGRRLPGARAKITDGVDTPLRKHVVHIGTNVEYARIHEYGGMILPKNGKYLAIPINPMAKNKSPLDFNNTFIVNRGGRLFVAYRPIFVSRNRHDKRSKGRRNAQDKVVFLFRLKRSVIIPARSYLRRAFDENKAEAKQIFNDTISEMVVNG